MNQVLVITKKGLVIKFNSEDVRAQLRGGKGVKAITLSDGDEVVGVVSIDN